MRLGGIRRRRKDNRASKANVPRASQGSTESRPTRIRRKDRYLLIDGLVMFVLELPAGNRQHIFWEYFNQAPVQSFMSAKLDINALKMASPCPARWEDMQGDERSRFCLHCQKQVYNFSAMTPKEVEALVTEKEGHLCARMYRRRDGKVLTADCPTGQAVAKRKRLHWVAMAAAGIVTMLSSVMVKAQENEDEDESPLIASVKEKWYELEVRLGIVKPQPKFILGAIVLKNPPTPSPSQSTFNIPPSPPPNPSPSNTQTGKP